jgi:polyphosphate glucokinase
MEPTPKVQALRILAIDVGSTHVKVKCSTGDDVRKLPSGRKMTADHMVAAVQELTQDWDYDVISIGFPGPVIHGKIPHEPGRIGPGWVHYDFEKAFGRPVKIINDAVMQAIGSYESGRMLLLDLGTGLGTAMMVDGVVQPLEMGHLPYKKGHTYEEYVGLRGLKRLGKRRWRKAVAKVAEDLSVALEPDYVVLGGGNAKFLKALPVNGRLGSNANAFIGGFRIWTDSYARQL